LIPALWVKIKNNLASFYLGKEEFLEVLFFKKAHYSMVEIFPVYLSPGESDLISIIHYLSVLYTLETDRIRR